MYGGRDCTTMGIYLMPLRNGLNGFMYILGLPWWLNWWRICLQCRRPGFDPWVGKIPWRRERLPTRASLVAQLVKNLLAMWETWVWSLGWEDPLEKGKVTHSSILAWRIPWTWNSPLYSPWGHKELDLTEWLSLSSIGSLVLHFLP